MTSELRKTAPEAFEPLDSVDHGIIAELQSDARVRVAELGRRVGLSPPAVAERLRRLEDTGVVTFRTDVNPRALGYTLSAIVRVSPVSGHVHAIPDIARQTPEITECYRITGEDCYFMRLYLRSRSSIVSSRTGAPRPRSFTRLRSGPGHSRPGSRRSRPGPGRSRPRPRTRGP
jgi:Lrp/AsnC family transcriptional regulator, leucine-responsive regulatory protein